MIKAGYFLLILFFVFTAGCATNVEQAQNANNPYTPGQVSLTLKKGVTTQSEVANVFGSPNIVTQSSAGGQTWIYQKDHVETTTTGGNSYITILLMGASHSSEQVQREDKTMTLVLHFNKQGILTRYKSMATSF